MATTAQIASIQQLYVAYFNRPADAAGLDFWAKQVDNGATLDTISATFAGTPEYKALFAGMSNDQVVSTIYQNLFNRAPDAAGLKFWSDKLTDRALTVDNVVAAVAASAQQDPAAGPDTVAIQSKVAAAVAFTDYLNTNVDARVAYSSGSVNAVGVNYIHGVIDATTLAAAKTALPTTTAADLQTGGTPGNTYALTLNPDTIVGTGGNDTFNASWDAVNSTKTLTDLDSIDGGNGKDILNVVQIGALDTTAVSATVKNVETVNLTSTADVTANTTAWTGVTALNANAVGLVAATAAATTNITANVSKATGATVVDGGSNVTVTATGAVGGSIVVGGTTAPTGAVVVTTTASGTAVASSDITVTGGSSVAVTSNLANTKVNTDITGGDIAVTGTAATTIVSVTQTAAVASAAKVAGIIDGKVTIIDVNAGEAVKAGTISTVSLTNYATGSSIDSSALTTLSLSGTAGTLDIGGGSLTKQTVTTLGLTVNGLKGANTITDTDSHFTTINVTASTKDSVIADLAASAATALTVAGDAAVTFTSAAGLSALKTVTVTGAAGVSIDVSGIASVTAVDASATTGDNTVTVAADQTSFAGGAGVDTVTITKDATKAISGGAGTADELVLDAAAASFTTGAGDTDITGFEILGLGTAATGTYDATGFAALHIAGTVTGAVTFGNVAAGAALTIDAAPGQDVTYSLKTNTGADAAVVNLGSATVDGIDFSGKAINLTSVESVTLNSLGSNEAAGVNKVDIVDATATSLTITGTESTTVTGFGGSTLSTIDATAIGADLTLDVTGVTLASAGVTFKGGDGNYLFTDTNLAAGKVLTYTAGNGDNTIIDSSATSGVAKITLGNGDNSIDLGATTGVNTVSVGTGINSIVLGTGASIVTVAADTNTSADIDTITIGVPATANNYATITGLGKGDVLDFANKGVEVWAGGTGATAKVTLDPSTALFADYVAAAAAGDGSTNGAFSWFQFGGNTYVVEDKSAGAAFVANTDVIVKLTGLVDLTKAVVGDHIITLA